MITNIKRMSHWFLCAALVTFNYSLLTSCENGDQEFDDFDYQTVYFAQQTPIRTIVLGNDAVYDNTLDNNHHFQIYATVGGVWKNRYDRTIKVVVDESLCVGKQFADGRDVIPLPTTHYNLLGNNTITIPEGEIMGCIEVELTDAFFNDEKSLDLNYVLPLRILDAADSILDKKDYTLYAVKYINKYDGAWISYGTDEIDLNGVKTTVKREATYLERNEIRYITSLGLNVCSYPHETTVNTHELKVENDNGVEKTVIKEVSKTLYCDLKLSFDGSDNCVASTTSANCVASGTGSWTSLGAIKAWGDKDRDAMALNYTIDYAYTDYVDQAGTPVAVTRHKIIKSEDNLVMRDRQEKFETFSTK